MKNIYLFQPQYAVEFRKETNYWIPYSAGCLWSYVAQYPDITDNFNLAGIIFRREDPEDILARISEPVLCGFCCYIWNAQYCLHLAKLIKDLYPECVIVFGGPQTSKKMLDLGYVDVIVQGEGEESFLEILRGVQKSEPIKTVYDKKRLQVLDIPSPYTTGLFDDIISSHPDAVWAMTFETNRGCPYGCTFCDWGGVTYSKVKKFNLEKVEADLRWAQDNPVTYLICADANFGIFKERDVEIAKIIKDVADHSRIDAVNLQYAKNSTEIVFEIAKIIGNLSRGITVSVQSMNPDTLVAIDRKNLDTNNIKHLMELSEIHDVLTYTEFILGLPLETTESWRTGLADALEAGQHNYIDIWLCQLLENSEMAQPASRSKYQITSIKATDYTTLSNPDDWGNLSEVVEIVTSTSTLTTAEIIECYMYAWVIIHLHCGGYTQLYAKYLRFAHDISYRKFYDILFERIQQSPVFIEQFNLIRDLITEYLTTGAFSQRNDVSGHAIFALSYTFMYEQKKYLYEMSAEVVKSLTELPQSLNLLQENFIFDFSCKYPVVIESEFDIKTWTQTGVRYSVEPHEKFSKLLNYDEHDFYRLRRHGIHKNKFLEN
jgi:hypothetical protein